MPNKWIRTAAAVLCLLLGMSGLASAKAAVERDGSSDVMLRRDDLVLSVTEDFAIAAGGTQQLSVVATGGTAPLSYQWEIYRDGLGWTTAPGTANAANYSIANAQPNTPATAPYRYRVTVSDTGGTVKTAEVQVLVSNAYSYKTVSLRNGDAQVAGYIHDDARLVLSAIPESDPAAVQLEAARETGQATLMLRDVSLIYPGGTAAPYFGPLQIGFDVGQAYNGQTLTVFRLTNSGVERLTGTVSGGRLTVAADALSPSSFAVMVPAAYVPLHTITARVAASGNGSISPAGSIAVAEGASKTFTFLPNDGYALDALLVDGMPATVTGNSYTFANVADDHTAVVSFRAVTASDTIHTVTVSSGANGSVSPTGTVSVRHGAAQTFYFYPNVGYELDTVLVNGQAVNVLGNSLTLSAVEADLTLAASFRTASTQRPTVYRTITATAGGHGSISPSGTVNVEYGGRMYFYFIPDTGYAVDKVFVDNVETATDGVSYRFPAVTENRTIRVTFVDSTTPPTTFHYITATSGAHGGINPAGSVQVADGGSQTFYFSALSGYEVDTILIDGVPFNSATRQYTFENVQSDHTIEVRYRRISSVPPTGDSDQPRLWILLAVASALLIAVCVLYLKKLTKAQNGDRTQ